MDDKPKLKLVFAGIYSQAVAFARAQRWQQNDWRYIENKNSIQGLNSFDLYVTGTFIYRRDYHEVVQMLQMRKAGAPDTVNLSALGL